MCFILVYGCVWGWMKSSHAASPNCYFMAKRESVDSLLSAQLRVSRPVAACSRCRSAKIKCDGKLPACTACERAGKADSCSGANDDYAKGKERSYVAALEAALERLQKRLAETKLLQATDPGRQDSAAASCMPGPGHAFQTRRIASGGRIHRKEASDVDNLVGDFGFLSVNATSRDFHGFTTTMSFARLLLSASKIGNVPQMEKRCLPARQTIAPLIRFYFDKVFVLMPFFSESDFLASVSAVCADGDRPAKAMDHWMVRMVLAVVAASSSKEMGDIHWRVAQEHVFNALHHVDDVLHPGSIAGLQAILILVQYSMVDPGPLSCWHLIGFASRVMVDLGLHNEPAAEVRISKDEIEMRRRVFYTVYTLDRDISMALGRAFTFTDDSASVNLPAVPHSNIPSDPSQHTGPQLFLRSLKPSLYLFKIRRIQSAVYQELHSSNRSEWSALEVSAYTNSKRKEIQSWASSIPITLAQWPAIVFRLESIYSEIITLAPSSRCQNITELSKQLIFDRAIHFAEQMHPITRDNKWHSFFTITDLQRIDYIGRQFLSVMWASFDHLLSSTVRHQPPVLSPKSSEPSPGSPSEPTEKICHSHSPSGNCVQAICCLENINNILAYAVKRFGISCSHIRYNFERESAVMLNKLQMKLKEFNTLQVVTGGPGPRHQQPPRQQPPQSLLEPQQPAYRHPIGLPLNYPVPPQSQCSREIPPGPNNPTPNALYDFEIDSNGGPPGRLPLNLPPTGWDSSKPLPLPTHDYLTAKDLAPILPPGYPLSNMEAEIRVPGALIRDFIIQQQGIPSMQENVNAAPPGLGNLAYELNMRRAAGETGLGGRG